MINSADQIKQGGFTSTTGADDNNELPPFDLHINSADVFDNFIAAFVSFMEIQNFNQ